MVYGQWHGEITEDNSGFALMSIDKLQEDKVGSISLVPSANRNEIPVIARITFLTVCSNNIQGKLDRFLGFGDVGIIFPQNSDKYQLSSSGTFKGQFFDENGQVYLKADWETDLGFKGQVTFKRVSPPIANPVGKIISWRDFKEKVEKYKYGTFFRGQNSSKHPLRTKFHRKGCWDLYRHYNEAIPELLDYMGVLNNTRYSFFNDVDFVSALSLAQHHKYPTSLLDWTLSPYVAAYFAFREDAIEHNSNNSVRVFAFHAERWIAEQSQYIKGGIISPGIILKPLKIPLAGNKRAVAQSARSVFSNVENIENVLSWAQFDKPDTSPMPESYIDYFDIDIKERKNVLDDLNFMNINEMSLFPDLDTAGKELGRKYFGKYYDNEYQH